MNFNYEKDECNEFSYEKDESNKFTYEKGNLKTLKTKQKNSFFQRKIITLNII